MIKRLLIGLVLGLFLGGLVALALVKGLGVVAFGGGLGVLVAYASAAAVGLLAGLVAGKPIWAKGGKLEAGLKAFFGTVLAAGGLFALQRWAPWSVDLTAFDAGAGPVGQLPAVALPVVGAVLAALFELDNTPEPAKETPRARVSTGGARVASARAPESATDGEDEAAPRARRGQR
jgi:hypothetical protein